MNNKNLIFIPVFNNQKQIINVLEDLKSLELKSFQTILFIDNNSKDLTFDIIKKETFNYKFKTQLIKNKKNIGLGGSFKIAINYALNNNFDYMFHYHGNNMNSINDLLRILKIAKYKNFDFYFGSRFEKGSKIINYFFFKKIGNLLFNLLYSIFLKKKITDLGGPINVYKISNFKDKLFENFSNDLTFQYYLLLYAVFFKKKYKFFPINIKINHKSNVVPMAHIFSMIKILVRFVFKRSYFFDK
jgi:hypothetical protein